MIESGFPTPTGWAAGVDPCCYVVFVDIYDRAIVNNSYSGRHANSNWRPPAQSPLPNAKATNDHDLGAR